MDTLLSRTSLAVFLLAFLLVAGLLPTLRLHRRTGVNAFVAHRAPSAVHQVAVDGMRLVVGGLGAWVALHGVLGPESLGVWHVPTAVTWTGWGLMAAGLVLVVLAQCQMGSSWRVGIDTAPTALVTHGLFRRVRNPIFSGVLLSALGLVAVTPSAWTVMGWLFLAWVLALQVRLEEEHLLRLHGEAYRTYASQAGRFVPGVGRLAASEEQSAPQPVARA